MESRNEGVKIGKTRWKRIGLLVFISYLIAFADRSNIGVAAPQMAHDLQLGTTITGALLSAFFWGYLVTQIPGGWLASRIGPSRVIAVAIGGSADENRRNDERPCKTHHAHDIGLFGTLIWCLLFLRSEPAFARIGLVALLLSFTVLALPPKVLRDSPALKQFK